MGTGVDVAIRASDLTLVRGGLRAAADAIRLARARSVFVVTNSPRPRRFARCRATPPPPPAVR